MKKIKVFCIITAMCLTCGNIPTVFAETAGEETSQVASVSELSSVEEVVEDWMVPIYAEELNDGVYDIEVASSSPMFRVEECVLTVANGEMSAVMTMSGTGYLKVFMGTGTEAVLASEEEYIPYVELEDGRHSYEVPVEALDSGIACTSFSKNREKWYDRTMVFLSTSLPFDAFKEMDITFPEELNLEDGTYMVEVMLEGAVGKTALESPTELYVEGDLVMAEITFGSSNYDYVIMDGEKCSLINEDGNFSFIIPVVGFDYNLPLVADSIALGKPRELNYLIRFDSETIQRIE